MLCKNPVFQQKPTCHILVIRESLLSTGFCQYTGSQVCFSLFSNQERWKPMYFYTFSQPIPLVFYLFPLIISSLNLRVLLFSFCRIAWEGGNISAVFSDVAHFQLFCFIYSLVSRLVASQRTVVMMKVSSHSLPVSVCVWTWFLIFEFQSEYKDFVFRFSWFFLQVSMLQVSMKLLIYKLLSDTWFHLLHSVLFNI